MRLLYLMPGNVTGGPLGAGEILRRRRILEQWADPDVTVEVWDLPDGPLSIESPEDEARCVAPMLERVVEAERSGFDAVLVGCFGDPGVEVAGQRVSIPVLGPAQTSFYQAALLGTRFTILTVVSGVVPIMQRLVKRHEMERWLASIRVIGTGVLALACDRTRTQRVLLEQGSRAIQEDGAGALILGCMSMAFEEGLAGRLQAGLGVPVINPAHTVLLSAQALGRMDLMRRVRTCAPLEAI
jgi:allantoin racemase